MLWEYKSQKAFNNAGFKVYLIGGGRGEKRANSSRRLHHHVAANQKARRIFYKKYGFTLSAAVPLSRKTYWVLREEHLHLAALFCRSSSFFV